MSLLSVHRLCVDRGGLPVLTGLDFTVAAGQALVLRGPNGIGKTTLLRCLAGLQPPSSGGIHVPPEGVAYAAHADGVKPTLTVAENLEFWARVFGTGNIAKALESLHLQSLATRPAAQLSAGQKRRLGLARLLVSGRSVWVMDEPTVSLDAVSVALFATVVTEHLAKGGAAIIATHIDLGISATVLELGPFKAGLGTLSAFDEAFL
jgi:heme exporter protein A